MRKIFRILFINCLLLMSVLTSHQNNKFYIVGHTDDSGDFTSNMTLSEERVKALINDNSNKKQHLYY